MKELEHHFSEKYPLFYKIKVQKGKIIKTKITHKSQQSKYFYRSALDNALKTNQMRAISLNIDYIVKFQNNYQSSFLFKKNLHQIIAKGISVQSLFESKV